MRRPSFRCAAFVGICSLLSFGCNPQPAMESPDAAARDAGGARTVDAGRVDDAGAGRGSDPGAALASLRTREVGALEPTVLLDGVLVTYVRAAAEGDDPVGFFVQAGPTGPAAHVAVPPETLSPVPEAGDTVSFSVTRLERISEQLRVTAIDGWSRTDQGADLSALEQDLSMAVNADSVDVYESEWVTASGTLSGSAVPGGTGHRRFGFVTAVVDSDRLSLRLPDPLYEATGIGEGCEVTVGPSPAWRFRDVTQLMVYEPSHLTVTSCPAPSVVSAETVSPTVVRVRFSRPLDAATVTASDFMFVGGARALSATAAAVDGAEVAVTTEPMEDGVPYTIIVTGVVDITGTALGSSNTAMFTGLGDGSPSLLFTEYVEGSGVNRALEISNAGEVGITLDRCTLHLYPNGAPGPTVALPSTRLHAGGSFVVCHGMSSAETMARCDSVNTIPTVFNGNDTLELRCDGAVVDTFGQVGFDPGAAWTSGSVSTVDQTLRRDCDVTAGDSVGDDAFDVGLQWSAHPLNDVSDLGVHCD